MLLLMETWLAACFWVSDCTNCSIVKPSSKSRCSIQVSGNAKAGLCPCNRRASSATNELTMGGLDRAMSAESYLNLTRIRRGRPPEPATGEFFPHVLLRFRGSVFTSACLVFEKPAA